MKKVAIFLCIGIILFSVSGVIADCELRWKADFSMENSCSDCMHICTYSDFKNCDCMYRIDDAFCFYDKYACWPIPDYGLYGNWASKADRLHAMDFNGDGLDDIVFGPSTSGNWYFLRSTGTGFIDEGEIANNLYGNWASKAARIRAMDFNGDGLDDILLGPSDSGYWFLLRSTGVGFVDEGSIASGLYGNWYTKADRIRPMDFNGDGLDDILLGPSNNGYWHVLRSTGTGFVNQVNVASGLYGNWYTKADRIRPMDFNGDGLDDILLGPSNNGYWHVLRSTSTGFVNQVNVASSLYGNWASKADRIHAMDFNSDGFDDIVLGPSDSGSWIWLKSTGVGFTNEGSIASGLYGNWYTKANRIRPMDFNGDGLDDIGLGPSDSGHWYKLQSTGSTFTSSELEAE